ncbi:MAG: hypothetical protein QXU46_02260 [Candidatus Bathyarchaeia archaeon]
MRELEQVKDSRLELIVGNMLDEKAVIEAMSNTDVVYHLALAIPLKISNRLLST